VGNVSQSVSTHFNNNKNIDMLKAYKFRIYHIKTQKAKMDRTLDLCRWVYNQTLALRKDAWEKECKSISRYDTHNLLPVWKEDNKKRM